MGLRGRKSILREAMKSLLEQNRANGIAFALIEQRLGAVDRSRLIKLLDNMKLCGEAHCTRSKVGDTATWLPGCEDPDSAPPTISPAEWVRLKRARQADQANPIVFYGSDLKGGRCASVWEYARHYQEQRA